MLLKFFYLLILLIHFNGDEVQGLREKLDLAKRNRFVDPNVNFRRASLRIENLISILKNGNRVNQKSVLNEIIDIVNSLYLIKNDQMDSGPINPGYWYTRQG